MTSKAAEAERIAGNPLLEGLMTYAPLPGIADEMVSPDGSIRPAWQKLLSALGRMDETELANRFARADRYLSAMPACSTAPTARTPAASAPGRCPIFPS